MPLLFQWYHWINRGLFLGLSKNRGKMSRFCLRYLVNDFSHISNLIFVLSSVLISSGSLLHAGAAFLNVRMSLSTILTSIDSYLSEYKANWQRQS
jgi:hypothetical protein